MQSAHLAAAIVTVLANLLIGLGAAAPVGAQTALLPPPAAGDVCRFEGGTTDEVGGKLYEGTNAARNLVKIHPFRLVKYPCSRPAAYRAVHVKVGRLDLIEGGRLVSQVFTGFGKARYSFASLAGSLSRSGWIKQVEPGVYDVEAALVQAEGTTLVAVAPVRSIRLVDRPGVFMGGQAATARFEGVSVTSRAADSSGPDLEVADGRPFVVYGDSSRLDVVASEFSFLGSDRTSAYGVNWGLDTTGEVIGSTFRGNFFGVFTDRARDIVFRKNVFRDNIFYGFDPHTETRNLLVEDNEAFDNGSHGFIGSGDVTDSVFRNNRSHDNLGSGIVLDRQSSRNIIENNLVDNNRGDGIVIHGSSTNRVTGNTVRGHRVGVRVDQPGSRGNVIAGNIIDRSGVGIWSHGGASDLTLAGNSVTASQQAGMILDAARSTVEGGSISGGPRGLDVRTYTMITDLGVTDVDDGVLVRGTGIAEMSGVRVQARNRATVIESDGFLQAERSTLQGSAPRVLRPDSPWLALGGAAAVGLAVVLHLVARARLRVYHRRIRRRAVRLA